MTRTGRPEDPVDPATSPVAAFASDLRELKREAGDPSYREMAHRLAKTKHVRSHSVLADAAKGRSLPSWDTVGEAYRLGLDSTRRDFNQGWFERLEVDCDEDRVVSVSDTRRTELGAALMTARVIGQIERQQLAAQGALAGGWDGGDLSSELQNEEERRSWRYGVLSYVGGSNVASLVGAEGLEPPTLSV